MENNPYKMIKRIFHILVLFCATAGFSQAITVDTNTYTVPQLVSEILINSPCLQTTNISWSTGSNFGSSNGIGYFESTNPNFPIQKGVILSTGNVSDAAGPNTTIQNGGNASWPGDTDLENTMAAAGNPFSSINATVLEFDFVPISTNFSFDFLFASEEYANFQCLFSDAFAYLLTNTVTGITTNLAVVPNTNTPISVVTVRDRAYNSGCASSNNLYFDNYYGGALAPSAATNFNGNTVKMTASAVLTPNVKYHMKLVIADRLNSGFDSAIFLSSQSFNLSQNVLGPDLTVADKTAICVGETAPDLKTNLDPSIYSFQWKKGNSILIGETGPTLSGVTAGTYSVTYTNFINVCQPITDTILIENYPAIRSGNSNDIYKCDTGQARYDYNLDKNTATLLTGSGSPATPFEVTYHSSLSDAENEINTLPLLYNSPPNSTIYARVENQITKCFIVKTFKLLTTPKPLATKPDDLIQCSTTPTAIFNLSATRPQILNGQSPTLNTLIYYKSQNEADVGVGSINSTSYSSTGQTIYTRVQNRDDASCFSTTNFKIIVNIIPVLDTINPKFICKPFVLKTLTYGNYYDEPLGKGNQYFPGDIIDKNSIDPLNNVKTLYIYDPNILCKPAPQNTFTITFVDLPKITPEDGTYCSNVGFTLPSLTYGKYYTEPDGNGTELPAGTVIKTSQTIYTYFKSPDDPTCITFSSFNITIIDAPILPAFQNVYDCASYTLPPLSNGKYYDQPDGKGNEIAAGTVITSTKTIYVYAEIVSGSYTCPDSKSFRVIIDSTVTLPSPIIACESAILPILPVGNYYKNPGGIGEIVPFDTVIDVTTQLYIYIPATSCPSIDSPFLVTIKLPQINNPNDLSPHCGSYKLLPLTAGNYYTGYRGTGTKLDAGYEINETKTIYIYNRVGSCEDNKIVFSIIINKYPIIDNRADIDLCGGEDYVLTPMSTGSDGNYYGGPGGSVELFKSGDIIKTTKTIYIYATTNSDPPCPVENYFTISFSPRVDVLNPGVVCEQYTLPPLNFGNYYTGPNATGEQKFPGDILLTSQKIYIYGSTTIRENAIVCSDESSFFVTVAKPILFTPPQPRTLCDEDGINDGETNIVSTTLTEDILSGLPLPSTEYNVDYFDNSTDATLGTNPIFTLKSQKIFFRIYNKATPTCFSDIGDVDVVVSKIPEPNPKGGFICVDKNIPFIINSELSSSNYTFEWYNNNASTLMPLETGNSISVTIPDTYGVKATDNISNCSSKIIAVDVIGSSAPIDISFTSSEAFEDNQMVTVIATGNGGDYEYQLDFGPFQDSPNFTNIPPGEHLFTVRDKNGCGSTTKSITLINYPKYFTPNSDGYNETWNIIGLERQANSIVYIYDRYGKLLKQIKPSGFGWDGNYNGRPLPSSDYWFNVLYEENGVTKEFKSHFSLKR